MKMLYTVEFYKVGKLLGDRALRLNTVQLNLPDNKTAWVVLETVRAALPADCGAGMVDDHSRNVRPEEDEFA